MAADAFPALAAPDNEATDFAVLSNFQKLMFRGVNPARDFRCFRDEDNVLVSLENALEAFSHRASVHGITEFPAQLRDRRRVGYGCFPNVQCIHETTLSFFEVAFYTSVRRNAA